MKKRALATAIASRTKLVSVLERVATRPGLAVLVYHRILPTEGHEYDTAVIEAAPEQFDEQMGMLRKRYSVATPEELGDIIEHPKHLRHFRVAVTFDDGYRDNYTNAFPILKSHGLSALFFLSTQYVGTHRLPWWDRIAFTIRNTPLSRITLEYPSRVVVDIDPSDIDAAIRTIIRAYSRTPDVALERFLEEVERACGRALPEEAEERQFLSFEEATEMTRAGMGIGSHTHSHTILGNLSPAEQLQECEQSRDILRGKRLFPSCIAYPVGKRTSFTTATKTCVRESGYRYAFSNYGGINLPESMDRFDVQRLGMNLDETTPDLRFRLAMSRLRGRAAW